jgi:hypothetical protein
MKYTRLAMGVMCVGLCSCAAHKPYYSRTQKDWQAKTEEIARQTPEFTLFLVGDAGKPQIHDKVLADLQNDIKRCNTRCATVFLGDNIYTFGLPPEGHAGRPKALARLEAQLQAVEGSRAIFIPGNHDWAASFKSGWTHIKEQENYVEKRGFEFLPDGGCPGPATVPLSEHAVLVVLDTHWWIHNQEKPEGGECGPTAPDPWFDRLNDLILSQTGKRVIVAGHHPLYSRGPHGGRLPLREWFFPLTSINEKLWVPLPPLSFLFCLGRMTIGSDSDMAHPRYRFLRKRLLSVFNQHPGLVYASGHEHTLQYFHRSHVHHIVSGSASKMGYVQRGGKDNFGLQKKGYVRLHVFSDGRLLAEYVVSANVVFRKLMQ